MKYRNAHQKTNCLIMRSSTVSNYVEHEWHDCFRFAEQPNDKLIDYAVENFMRHACVIITDYWNKLCKNVNFIIRRAFGSRACTSNL